MLPSAFTLAYTSPLAPICGRLTKSVNSSNCLRVYSAQPFAQIPTTNSELSKTGKPAGNGDVACNVSTGADFNSTNVISKRVSGLSLP